MRKTNPFFTLTILASIGVLTACGGHKKGFAPEPPQFTYSEAKTNQKDFSMNVSKLADIQPASGLTAPDLDVRSSYRDHAQPVKCDIQDRFDRKALIAYKWGQNRLGFDVDGIGLDGVDVEEFKLTYSLRLQPIQKPKERCKRGASWQGMLGTGYTEMIKHDGAAVKQEWRDFRNDFADKIGYFTP